MSKEKLYYIEILKVFIISLVIPTHTLTIFVDNAGSYIRDFTVGSEAMTLFARSLWQWMMFLMFFISGITAYYSLKKHSARQFIIERLKRLYVPLVFGTLCLVSVQTYFLAKNQYGFKGSFFDFFPIYFFNGLGMSPSGYFNWGHLWFLSYLFHISLVALPFFTYCLKDDKPYFIQKVLQMVKRGGIILPLFLLILVECIFRAHWPSNLGLINDWANFFFFLILFIYGFFYGGGYINVTISKPIYPYFFFIAIISMMIYLFLPILPGAYTLGFVFTRIWAAFNTWACIVFLIDISRHKFNFMNSTIKYASDLAMSVYVLHYIILTTIAFYVVQLQINLFTKMVLIIIPSYVITIVVSELVKRVSILRFLLGLK